MRAFDSEDINGSVMWIRENRYRIKLWGIKLIDLQNGKTVAGMEDWWEDLYEDLIYECLKGGKMLGREIIKKYEDRVRG